MSRTLIKSQSSVAVFRDERGATPRQSEPATIALDMEAVATALCRRVLESTGRDVSTERGGYSLGMREHFPVVAIPVALKALAGIVFPFQFEKFVELRITRRDLVARREFVIRQIVASASRDC